MLEEAVRDPAAARRADRRRRRGGRIRSARRRPDPERRSGGGTAAPQRTRRAQHPERLARDPRSHRRRPVRARARRAASRSPCSSWWPCRPSCSTRPCRRTPVGSVACFVAVEDRLERLKSWFIRVTRSRALASGILVLVLSLIYGFTDPDVRLRSRLAAPRALARDRHVHPDLPDRMGHRAAEPRDLGRALAGGPPARRSRSSRSSACIAARILEFSPGFFVGVVIGLELLQASQRVASRVALLQFSLVVGVAVGAWLWYSALISGGPPTDFGGALLGDTLVALTAEGLTAAAIAILPLRFLEGRELYKESKAALARRVPHHRVRVRAARAADGDRGHRGRRRRSLGDRVRVLRGRDLRAVGDLRRGSSVGARQAEERNTAQHDKVRG